jgi:hypothetical protein
VKQGRPHWDFGYEPSARAYAPRAPNAKTPLDAVIAARGPLEKETLRRALRDLGPDLGIETMIERAPLFWTRVRAPAFASPQDVSDLLVQAEIRVRYVASASTGTMSMPPLLDLSEAPKARAAAWPALEARPVPAGSSYEGHWFLGEGGGMRVDRRVCGTGAGTRLAVIDDDAADLEHVDLDDRVSVGLNLAPAASGHAGLMVGWATNARRPDGQRFIGIAPDASVRVYLIPKPDVDVASLPLAVARAVFDGADVIVCATYLEGTTSPLLDDALDVATHLGRNGRGTVVVLPTGRDAASPGASVHASLSLELGDPASDPRVHCVAPGSRLGGWFLWKTPQGKLRPFANRGPAVRWLAAGDDLAYPFSSRDRLFHAESSGASAIAAGVLLLLLGCNPELEMHEVQAVLARSSDVPNDSVAPQSAVADPADLLPSGRDRDGHDAKCGYGRLNATRACALAADPFALELAAIGEDDLAVSWRLRPGRPYTDRLARWAVRTLLVRPDLENAVRAVIRHIRLAAMEPVRTHAHAPGALARQLLLVARLLERANAPPPVREELGALGLKLGLGKTALGGSAVEQFVCSTFRDLARETASKYGEGGFSTVRLES